MSDGGPAPLVELRPTCLLILPGLSWEEWEGAWRSLDQTSRSIPWLIGDALVYAQDSFGEQWSQAADADYAEQYGRYLRVSRLIPASERREDFSWSAHRELAALSPAERAEVFELAEANGWRSREIRDEVQRRKTERATYPSNAAPPAKPRSTWNADDDIDGDPTEAAGREEAAEAPETPPRPFPPPVPPASETADQIRALIDAVRRLAPDLSADWKFGAIVDGGRGPSTVRLTKGEQLAIGVGPSLPCAIIEAGLAALLSDLGME